MNPIRKISKWYFTRNALPYGCILALDCVCVYISGLISYYVEYGGDDTANHFWQLSFGLALSLVFYLVSFRIFHTYREVIRYSSFVDLQRTIVAMVVASALVCLVHYGVDVTNLSEKLIIPNLQSTAIILVLATMLMWLMRILVKNCYDTYRTSDNTKRVFIYGAMSGGIALAKSVRNTPNSPYTLSGIISTDAHVAKSWMMGIKVLLDTDDIPRLMKEKGAEVLLVSPIQSDRFRSRTTLIDGLLKEGIKILMMPPAEEWDGKADLSHNQLKEVEIEDLLPRQKIEVDMQAIGQMLRGKRILITGAAGSIGSEMARQVAKFQPSDLILIDQAETPMHDERLWMKNYFDTTESITHVETIVTSICKKERMEKIFSEHTPEYVFHAAAYKHVPMMEDNPAEAVQNNIYGTRVIADLAVKYGTKKFVMISTDKAVNPTNVMGCSKRICEIYCQALNYHQQTTQFVTTRFGNVLGSNGSVIPIFREQIKKGGPVKVTHKDIIRYFMLIPEACRLVLEAGTMGHGGEIFVFDMGEPVKIVDLAQRMINLYGAHNIEIKFTGLRDGEKLYEEVLNDAEQTKPTHHPKIKVAAVREYPYELALRNEEELYNLSFSADDMSIVRKMKEIVPEYKSQNSKYQDLDNN